MAEGALIIKVSIINRVAAARMIFKYEIMEIIAADYLQSGHHFVVSDLERRRPGRHDYTRKGRNQGTTPSMLPSANESICSSRNATAGQSLSISAFNAPLP